MSSLTGLIIRHRTGASLNNGIRRQHPSTASSATRRLSSLTPVALPPALVPPKGIPAFVSRRQWNKLYKPPPRQPPPKDGADDKPWPQSIKILGFAAGVTVVPYMIAWFVASNPTLREILDPKFPGLLPALRPWFGEEEVDAISYVDRRQEGKQLDIPRALDNEYPTQVRKEQAALSALMEKYKVPTRIRVFTSSGFNLGEIMDLPGTTPANEEALLQVMMKDRGQSLDMDTVSHITVDFSDVKEEEGGENISDNMLEVRYVSSSDYSEQDGSSNQSTLQQQISSLLKQTSIFSAWHAFPEFTEAEKQKQQQSSTNTAAASDELRISQLEYEIEQLEKQLKDHTTMRSFDDINDEIAKFKSELRRLKWKRRLRIFG